MDAKREGRKAKKWEGVGRKGGVTETPKNDRGEKGKGKERGGKRWGEGDTNKKKRNPFTSALGWTRG